MSGPALVSGQREERAEDQEVERPQHQRHPTATAGARAVQPQEQPRFLLHSLRGAGRDRVDRFVCELLHLPRPDDADRLPRRLQAGGDRVSGRIEPEPAEIEVWLRGREAPRADHSAAILVPAARLGGGQRPSGGPRSLYEVDRCRRSHPGDPWNVVRGEGPSLPRRRDPDRIPRQEQRLAFPTLHISRLRSRDDSISRECQTDTPNAATPTHAGDDETMCESRIRYGIPVQLRQCQSATEPGREPPVQQRVGFRERSCPASPAEGASWTFPEKLYLAGGAVARDCEWGPSAELGSQRGRPSATTEPPAGPDPEHVDSACATDIEAAKRAWLQLQHPPIEGLQGALEADIEIVVPDSDANGIQGSIQVDAAHLEPFAALTLRLDVEQVEVEEADGRQRDRGQAQPREAEGSPDSRKGEGPYGDDETVQP